MAFKNEQDKVNYQKKYYQDNKARLREQQKQYYYKNKRHIQYVNWRWQITKRFGITEEDYNNLLNNQKSKCAICGRREFAKRGIVIKRLAVDHCHKTGQIRGLLCSKCNGTLGWYEQCKEKIENYLKNNLSF